MPTLDELIVRYGLAEHSVAIRSLVRPAVAIISERVSQEQLAPNQSRMGGLPHLPAGMAWPMFRKDPLTHIATIRLSEASKFDHSGILPRRGLLYFWYEAAWAPWGFDPANRGFIHVEFTPDEDQPLTLARLPIEKFSADLLEMLPKSGVFAPCRMQFQAVETLPNWRWICEFAPEHAAVGDGESYLELVAEWDTLNKSAHRLLGHSSLIQEPWELLNQLVTNGLYCGDSSEYSDPRAAALKAGAKDWRLLLQIDTDTDGPGWMWGDVGMIYFGIPEPALRAREFDKAWLTLQCF